METAARKLQQVDAVRQARLEAQQFCFQLDQARNELARKQAALEEVQQQVAALAAAHRGGPPCSVGCCSGEALQEARLQAADYKFKLQLTELELAKQLDELQELQWQLECVVVQLGLQPPGAPISSGGDGGSGSGPDRFSAAGIAPAPTSSVDHMLLLSKVEELRMAQLHLGEFKRRLAFTEAELAGAQSRCTTLQQQQQQRQRQPPGNSRASPVAHGGWQAGVAVPAGAGGRDNGELGAGGTLLVGELLQENELLRLRLAETEERYHSLERDYEVELLMKADAGAAPELSASQAGQQQQQQPGQSWQLGTQSQQEVRTSRLGQLQAGPDGSGGRGDMLPNAVRRQPLPVSHSMANIARQRLEFRLQEKDKQLGKLRGVVQELEGKLIDAYKRQADLAMKESSWREQEAQDRRIVQLDEEKARLAFAAQAAQAEAEAARKEAAVQRRLAKRLQQAATAAAEQQGAGGSSTQMADLLQKRVKVLEAQNIRLRLQAKSSKEDEGLAAAEAAAAASRSAHQAQGSASQVGGADGTAGLGAEESQEGAAPGENDSPNRAAAAGAGAAAGGGSSSDMMDDNPVLAKWQADKRLQKKVEALQGKLRDKTTALVSAQAGRSRAEEQAQQVQEQLLQCQAGMRGLQAQLRQAEQRLEPGTMVPAARLREQLLELEQLQQRFDALERQHVALQQQVPSGGSCGGGGSPAVSAVGGAADQGQQHAAARPSLSATRPYSSSGSLPATSSVFARDSSAALMRASTSSRAYQPDAYAGGQGTAAASSLAAPASPGAAQQAAAGLQAQLLAKDVQLLDAQLQREQAAAEAERQRRRLHDLLDSLSPHPQDAAATAAIAEARQLAGLPALTGVEVASAIGGKSGSRAPGKSGSGGGKRQQPSGREQELLDTIALLKSALERTKKGLESGVSSSKYMQAVDRAKQQKAQCRQLEEQLADAATVREELARVQQQLGALHGTASSLRSQLKAAKEQREEAGSAREHVLRAQVAELERTLQERDAQMETLNASIQQVDEEVRVLVAEGLRPADLIQELLVLRPRLRDLEQQNRALGAELTAFDDSVLLGLDALKGEHELLWQQCRQREAEIRKLCERTGEPVPQGMGETGPKAGPG